MAENIYTHKPSSESTLHHRMPSRGKAFFDWWRARLRALPRFGVLQAPASTTPATSWFHHERVLMPGWELVVRTLGDTRYIIRLR